MNWMGWDGNASFRITSAYSKVVAIAKAAGVADARWVQAMKNILWSIPNANYNCLRRVSASDTVALPYRSPQLMLGMKKKG